MAAFTIRPATLADAEALCALHKAAVRALFLGAYSAEEIEAWLRDREPARYRHAMTDGGQTMLVAEFDGVAAGFASAGCCWRRRRMRSDVAVLPS